jgi:hypothetical protein
MLIEQAASSGKLNKGTWNNCVFNAAAEEAGLPATKDIRHAKTIDPLAQQFISQWDALQGYTTENLLADVQSILDERGRPEPFYTVEMGRVKRVRRTRVAESTMFTMEDFNESLRELIEV